MIVGSQHLTGSKHRRAILVQEKVWCLPGIGTPPASYSPTKTGKLNLKNGWGAPREREIACNLITLPIILAAANTCCCHKLKNNRINQYVWSVHKTDRFLRIEIKDFKESNILYIPGLSQGCQSVPNGCQFTIPSGLIIGAPLKVLVYFYNSVMWQYDNMQQMSYNDWVLPINTFALDSEGQSGKCPFLEMSW